MSTMEPSLAAKRAPAMAPAPSVMRVLKVVSNRYSAPASVTFSFMRSNSSFMVHRPFLGKNAWWYGLSRSGWNS